MPMRRGTVTAFDEAEGLGTIVTVDGAMFRFHAIEIADGSRTIDVGDRVAFELLPRFGEFQAGAIHKL